MFSNVGQIHHFRVVTPVRAMMASGYRAGCLLDLLDGAVDLTRCGGNVVHALRDDLDALGGRLHVRRHVGRHGFLLFDGAGDARRNLVDLRDRRRDFANSSCGLRRIHLDCRDLPGDLVGRLGGLRSELLDLAGDDREPLAGVACPGGLDGGVERQKVGLRGDRIDEVDDFTDLLHSRIQRRHRRVGAVGLCDGRLRNFQRVRDLTADFRDRVGKLFRSGGNRLHVRRCLVRRRG